jgi:protein-disulfide isomerase
MIDRRQWLAGALGAVMIAAADTAFAQPVKVDLPDLVIGRTTAPVTIEEYASLTCSHCAAFHNTVLPQLKAKYIDTGKVRLVYRDFPLDELAVGAALLSRCQDGAKREAVIGVLFKTQEIWAFKAKSPLIELYKVGQQFGMKQDEMEICLANEIMFGAIVAQRDEADAKLKIEGTPTFFINGVRHDGPSTFAAFDKTLSALVK